MIQVDFTVPDLGQWQWRCWRKDRLKSYLEVRIDLTTGNRTLGERWYLFAAPQNARPETRVKVTAIDLLDASPKNWRWGKREANQDSYAMTACCMGHPGSWFTTEHRKRDNGSLSSTFFFFFFLAHKTPYKSYKKQTLPEAIHRKKKRDFISQVISCVLFTKTNKP